MRTSALVLGLIGGIVGLLMGIGSCTMGSCVGACASADPYGARVGTATTLWGFLCFLFSVVGLVGAALVKSKPVASAVLLFLGAAGGFLSGFISGALSGEFGGGTLGGFASAWVWSFPGILLLTAAALTYFSRGEKTAAT